MGVSVIVPTYNRATQLKNCLDSLIASHYKDLQIIVVDDGSTDCTKRICYDYCIKDKRIEYYYQTNQGVSAARNRGLKIAKMDWIAFCDSDDAVMPNHFNLVASYPCATKTLLMTGSRIAEIKDNKIVWPDSSATEIIKRASAVEYLFLKNIIHICTDFSLYGTNFFRRDIIEHKKLRFNESMSLDEDMHFTLMYLKEIKDIIYDTSPTYITIEWPGLSHLGRQLRPPEEYIAIHRLNYIEFINLFTATGNINIREFGAVYAVQRTIRLAFLDQADAVSAAFLKAHLVPFLKNFSVKIRIDLISKICFTCLCKNWIYLTIAIAYIFNFIKKIR